MKRHFAILSISMMIIALLSCNNINDNANKNGSLIVSSDSIEKTVMPKLPLDSVVDSLLYASAKDFRDHQPPLPINFRNVHFKYFKEKNYLICGEFLTKENQDKEKWTSFATIKTSGYEQWIGSNASVYCQDAKAIQSETQDLSSALKSKLDSL